MFINTVIINIAPVDKKNKNCLETICNSAGLVCLFAALVTALFKQSLRAQYRHRYLFISPVESDHNG